MFAIEFDQLLQAGHLRVNMAKTLDVPFQPPLTGPWAIRNLGAVAGKDFPESLPACSVNAENLSVFHCQLWYRDFSVSEHPVASLAAEIVRRKSLGWCIATTKTVQDGTIYFLPLSEFDKTLKEAVEGEGK